MHDENVKENGSRKTRAEEQAIDREPAKKR